MPSLSTAARSLISSFLLHGLLNARSTRQRHLIKEIIMILGVSLSLTEILKKISGPQVNFNFEKTPVLC